MYDNRPKVFISYCQQPESNKIKVLQLAERLTRDGIYVVIDEWDLHNGQDKNVFMEQMVNDEAVDKVLLLINKNYAEKANSRKGGVGIESTIISEEVYSQLDQTKFIPIVLEADESGKPYLPVFVKSRIYIDLSDDDKFEIGYDQLLRDLYNKQRSQRPPIGSMPSYLNNATPAYLPTAGLVEGIRKSINSESKYSNIKIKSYIDSFMDALLKYKIDSYSLNNKNFIEVVETQINEMQPLKNDFLFFIQVIADTEFCTPDFFVDFFEKLLQLYEDNRIELLTGADIGSFSCDNYRFFNYDLFLSFAVMMLKHERYDVLCAVAKYQYCVISKIHNNMAIAKNFTQFREYIYTLDRYKNERFSLSRVSVTADLIKQYAVNISFDELVSVDILLYYLSLIYPGEGYLDYYWYPTLSAYNRKSEIMPRLVSTRFFNKAKELFSVSSNDEFKNLVSRIQDRDIRDGYHFVPPIKVGLCLDKICTMN